MDKRILERFVARARDLRVAQSLCQFSQLLPLDSLGDGIRESNFQEFDDLRPIRKLVAQYIVETPKQRRIENRRMVRRRDGYS